MLSNNRLCLHAAAQCVF